MKNSANKRLLLLINAGSRQARERRDEIGPALEKHGFEIHQASEPHAEGFETIIERFGDKMDLVVGAGGDGTSLHIATVARRLKLPFGIIPLGTANNLARSLGIPLDIEGAAAVIGAGNLRSIDMAEVNGKPFFNVSGMGLSTQVNKKVPSHAKKRWGILAYIASSLNLLKHNRHFVAEVTCDGKVQRFKSRQISVCNGRFYGSGLSIAPDAAIDDGRLDLISAHVDKWWLAPFLGLLYFFKRHSPERGMRLLEGTNIHIRTVPIVDIDTDGEITTRTPADYSIHRKAVQVFAPY